MTKAWAFVLLSLGVKCLQLPQDCKQGEYYEPSTLSCRSCPANSSMITSSDGFGCSCDDNSVELSSVACRSCAATELRSADHGACVPRKCHTVAGRTACRKCPGGYISVTQNLDGSAMKEVQCIKCASGYRAQGNVCVRCKACSCSRQETAVRGICIPKQYTNTRPKYEEKNVQQDEIHEFIKNEYMCTQNDVRACRSLANECVKSLYSSDLGGPCRLWLISKSVTYKHLPSLNIEGTVNDGSDEIFLPKGTSALKLNFAVHTTNGGLELIREQVSRAIECAAPLEIIAGRDEARECNIDMSQLSIEAAGTLSPYLYVNGELRPLPVHLKTPSGSYIQRGSWSNTRFRRYFLYHKTTSAITNVTSTVYLRTLVIVLRLQRANVSGCLSVRVTMEAQYASMSVHSRTTTYLSVQNVMPSAGLLRALEIWCSVLGTCLCAYAGVVWRGGVQRGGGPHSLLPLLAAAIADALYFGAWFSTLHAMAVEAGFSGMMFPMSAREENMVKAFVYSAVSLKAVKVLWINWKQCRSDIFFLDWTKYNPTYKEVALETTTSWRMSCLAREWSRVQCKRRACLWHTVALALLFAALTETWQSHLPRNSSYKWAFVMVSWWTGYIVVLLLGWGLDRASQSFTKDITRICNALGISLLVFQEEYLAHYVHGRNEDSLDTRVMCGPLKTCRVVCAPQLRIIYKQLTTPVLGIIGETESRYVLLSKFLAAFFEKALDGLSWVASERTLPERLLDVELTDREAATTSLLLYDSDDTTPSCFNVTWWGEEWSLATLDAMVFGCILIITGDQYISAFSTIIIWQSMKILRSVLGDRNQMEKTRVNKHFY